MGGVYPCEDDGPEATMNATELLLSLVDEAFDRRAWHGTNLRGSIRGLDAATAALRPARGRHNIWELTVHTAYWKYAVRRRLTGEKRGSFVLPGSNYFARPGPDGPGEAAWRKDVALLVSEHRKLRRAIAAIRPADLGRTARGHKTTNLTLIRGIACHDVYHAGQIQLLKRLLARR
jgi:uncharacterized damage-inducible protein DinB